MHAVGLNASPTNVKASPLFIDVSPTVKVVPNSNKVPTYSASIAVKPHPDPGTVNNEFGKVLPSHPPCSLPACSHRVLQLHGQAGMWCTL